MRKRLITVFAALAAVAVLVLGGATLAFGGAHGAIFDDGRAVKPGSLDDGKELLPQTRLSLAQAIAAARKAANGQLGQVDLERLDGRVVYSVDVGDQEVRVDAGNGSVASVTPQD